LDALEQRLDETPAQIGRNEAPQDAEWLKVGQEPVGDRRHAVLGRLGVVGILDGRPHPLRALFDERLIVDEVRHGQCLESVEITAMGGFAN